MKFRLHLFALGLLATTPASPAVMQWSANLTPGQEITPPTLNGATPSGFGTVTFDDLANVLTISLNWQGLTGEATGGHIHCCVTTPPGNAGVVLGLWNPPSAPNQPATGAFDNTWDLDTENPFTSATFVTNNGGTPLAAFLTGLVPAMNDGNRAYLNVHTSLNPGGEIRGDLAPVPEPASVLVVLSGLGLIAFRRLYA